jgi:LysM repeat protein
VVRGETLASIAQRYGRDWRDLARWNNLRTPYTLEVGQRILISGGAITSPVAVNSDEVSQTAPTPEVVTPRRSGGGQYIIQPGDTVYSLARRSGYSVAELMSWNGLSRSQSLRVGQNFWLSPPGQVVTVTPGYRSQSVSVATPPASSSAYHVVVSGDTLYNVARRYGYTPQKLAAMNGLSPPYTLALGSTLQVGGGTRTVRKMSIASVSNSDLSGGSQYHTVSSGQTAYSIARMYGCTTAQLLAKNGLRSPTLRNKQRLNVSGCSGRASSSDTTFLAQSVGKTTYHIVKQNETLEGIAKLHGVTSHELALWNGIGSPYTVYPGHRLVINPR